MNQTVEKTAEQSLVARLMSCARTHADTVAVQAESLSLTYRELLSRAASVARQVAALDPGGDHDLAILADKPCELITALVAAALSQRPCVILSKSMWRRDFEDAIASRIVLTELEHAEEFCHNKLVLIETHSMPSAWRDAAPLESGRVSFEVHCPHALVTQAALEDTLTALHRHGFASANVAAFADSSSHAFLIEAWAALTSAGTLWMQGAGRDVACAYVLPATQSFARGIPASCKSLLLLGAEPRAEYSALIASTAVLVAKATARRRQGYLRIGPYTVIATTADIPLTPTQQRMLELWAEFLGSTDLSLDSNFFSLGGDSLRALKLVARVNHEFSRDIPWSQFLRSATLADFACIVDSAPSADNQVIAPSARRDAARFLEEAENMSESQVAELLRQNG